MHYVYYVTLFFVIFMSVIFVTCNIESAYSQLCHLKLLFLLFLLQFIVNFFRGAIPEKFLLTQCNMNINYQSQWLSSADVVCDLNALNV